jgi:predicted MPP superfamily phosphohydrolase
MIIAQLSDPHIGVPGTLLYGRVDTADFLARAVAEINRLEPRPDIVVLTGDLVAVGETPEYDHLCRILAPLPMPLFVIPGNHDARDRARRVRRRRLPPARRIYPSTSSRIIRCASSRSTRISRARTAACCAPNGSPGSLIR